jgi:hypothetical protein
MRALVRWWRRWVVRAEAGEHDEVLSYPYPSTTLRQYLHLDAARRRDRLVAALVLGAVEALLVLALTYGALSYLHVGPVGRVVVLALAGVFLVGGLSTQASVRVMWRHRHAPQVGARRR